MKFFSIILISLSVFFPLFLQAEEEKAVATFAGGCFWCMEPPFDKVKGVLSTTSGYMGGTKVNGNYSAVSSGRSEHAEVLQVAFNPKLVSFDELLKVFWLNIDPTVLNRQFCDTGKQYRSAIFFHTKKQQSLASASKKKIERSGVFKGPIETTINKAMDFYPAEEYHQDFYKKNPTRYYSYRKGCGRDRRLESLWSQNKEKIW